MNSLFPDNKEIDTLTTPLIIKTNEPIKRLQKNKKFLKIINIKFCMAQIDYIRRTFPLKIDAQKNLKKAFFARLI